MGRHSRRGLQSWINVSTHQLLASVVDPHELLSSMPAESSADEVAAFVCGRRDWPFLASTYMCLWKSVVDAMPDDWIWCIDALPPLRAAALSHHRPHGFAPHRYVLVRSAGLGRPAKKRIRGNMKPFVLNP